jgi:hypothetical protein
MSTDDQMQRENATVGEIRQRQDDDQIDEKMAIAINEQRNRMEKAAFREKVASRVFSVEEAVEMGIDKDADYKPKVAGYIKTQHEFIQLDKDRPDATPKYTAHKYGECVHCHQTPLQLLTAPAGRTDFYYCDAAAEAKRKAWGGKAAFKKS